MKQINKKNIRNVKKKLLAIIFLIITLFGTTQPIFAVSNSGTAYWIAGQWDSNVYTSDLNTNAEGILIRRLTNNYTAEQITTFCAEHFAVSTTDNVEVGTHSVPTTPEMKKACKVAYLRLVFKIW